MERPNVQSLHDMALRLLRRGAIVNLKKLLFKLHQTDVAELVKRLDAPFQDQILDLMQGSERLPLIFAELGSAFLEAYLRRHADYGRTADILQKLPPDDMADLIGALPEEISAELMRCMQSDKSRELSGLLEYPEASAGALMSTEVFKLKESTTISEAVSILQKTERAATVFYVYVVDDEGHLTGVLSIRHLFIAGPETPIKDIMFRDVIRVGVAESQEEVARLVAQYDLVAVPVIDEGGILVGVITVDDVIDVIKEEAAEDVLKMGSAQAHDLDESAFSESLKSRLKWFLLLVAGGIVVCEVIAHYYYLLPAAGLFVGLIPLILRFSSIIARQTSAITIQGLASGQISGLNHASQVLINQGKITVLVAALSSLMVAVYTGLRSDGPMGHLAWAVGLALFITMMLALVVGALLPLLLKRLRLDPALATGTVVNFILDVISLFIYFRLLSCFYGGR